MKGSLFMAGRCELKTTESDNVLVHRFVRQQDGEAFSILMGRYADMVYTTSWRILGDEALAADAVQETFFQLAKEANRITGSLGGWLHRVATRRAVDLVRKNVCRRNREQSYALETDAPANTWSEIEVAVDEALEEMPDNLREVLLLHFLQGRSTIQIAAEQGVSQPTISRRLAEALEVLREKLRDRGIAAAAVPLQAVLLHSNQIAPELLRAGLGKIALAKAAGAKGFWSFGSAKSTALFGAKFAVAASVVAFAAAMIWIKRVEASKPIMAASGEQRQGLVAVDPAQTGVSSEQNSALEAAAINDANQNPVPAPVAAAPAASRTQQTAETKSSPKSEGPPAGPSSPLATFGNPVTNPPSRNPAPPLVPSRVWPTPLSRPLAGFINRENKLNATFYGSPSSPLDKETIGTNYNSNDQIPIRNSRPAFAPARTPSAMPMPGSGGNSRRTGRVL